MSPEAIIQSGTSISIEGDVIITGFPRVIKNLSYTNVEIKDMRALGILRQLVGPESSIIFIADEKGLVIRDMRSVQRTKVEGDVRLFDRA